MFAFLLCPSLLHVLGAFWPFASLVASFLLLVCFAASRVPSFTAFVAPGRTWLLATPGFAELHKAPHFPKLLSSNTSLCEHFYLSTKTLFFKYALTTKTRFVQVPYVKQNTALQ